MWAAVNNTNMVRLRCHLHSDISLLKTQLKQPWMKHQKYHERHISNFTHSIHGSLHKTFIRTKGVISESRTTETCFSSVTCLLFNLFTVKITFGYKT